MAVSLSRQGLLDRNELAGRRIDAEQLGHALHERDEGVDDRRSELRATVSHHLVGRVVERPGGAVARRS